MAFDKESVFLVTGGAGFIGSNLVEVLLNAGYKVRVLDNLTTGRRKNVELFLAHENYSFILADITDFKSCLNATEGVDYVLHHAAQGSVSLSIELPRHFETVNIHGTLNMLEASRQNGVKKFVYASSASVYGDDPTLPKKEGLEGKVLSPYALTKEVNEKFARLYSDLYGLETYGLRYFNVFGKRQNPQGAYAAMIPKFIQKLLNNEQPTIHGDGQQSRDFTYIDNVIEANLKACKASSESAGEVFNIGNGEQQTLLDIYYMLCEALGKEIEPIFGPERAGDIRHSYADIQKAQYLLDYTPQWDFERGIKETIAWYTEQVNVG